MALLGWFLLQLLTTSAVGWLLLRHGVPGLAALHRRAHPDVPAMVSSWLALAVAMPSIVLGAQLGGPAGAAGAVGTGAALPAAAGLVALGTAILVRSRQGKGGEIDRPRPGGVSLAAVAAAATLLLVLSLERHLTVWTGQAAFALLAVLLWLGGPPRRRPDAPGDDLGPDVRRQEMHCGLVLTGATLLAVVEGFAVRGVLLAAESASGAATPGRGAGASAWANASLLLLAARTLLLAAVAGTLPGGLARRAAAWIVAVGVFGAVGVAALVRLPGLVGLALRGQDLPGTIIAGGFGAWAWAAAAALAVAAGLGLAARGGAGRLAGGACVVAGAIVVLGGW